MEQLRQRILQDGRLRDGDVLKVDSFLNHQMDIRLLEAVGEEFARRFSGVPITKILTIEASGIAVAAMASRAFGYVPVVFAKKAASRNLDGHLLHAQVRSFTKGKTYDVQVARRFLSPEDTVLVLDDFLARGQALLGLVSIVRQSGARLAGCGVVIEKGFQEGGRLLRVQGIRLESLAVIASVEDGRITFAEE